MVASLQVARAAFRELWRRYGLGAMALGLVLAGAFTHYHLSDRELVATWLEGGVVFLAVPALAAAGVERWVRGGPLRLARRSGREGATIASYALGTALWASPFCLALAVAGEANIVAPESSARLAALASLLLTTAGIGAAAGRLVRGAWPAIFTSWGLIAATAIGDLIFGFELSQHLPWTTFAVVAPAALLGLPAAVAAGTIWVSGKARHAALALGA